MPASFVNHLTSTVTKTTPSDFSQTSSLAVHTDANTLIELLLTSLPTLLLPHPNSPPVTVPIVKVPIVIVPPTTVSIAISVSPVLSPSLVNFNFTHKIRTSGDKNSKPVFESFTFNLSLTSTVNTVNDIECTFINFTTIKPPPHEINHNPPNLPSSTIPCTIAGTFQFTPQHHNTTQLDLTCTVATSSSSLAGAIAFGNATAPLFHLFTLLPTLHKAFARYSEIDILSLAEFADDVTNQRTKPLQQQESTLVTTSLKYDDQEWKRIPNTGKEVGVYGTRVWHTCMAVYGAYV